MGKLRIISAAAGILVILSVTQVHCFPRKKLIASLTDGRHSSNSRLASVLSDYWAERGFHDTLEDHLLASESQAKDLMLTGDDDELPSFRGSGKIRIPRGRLAPPRMSSKQRSLRKKLAANRARQQKRKRLLQKQMMLQRYPRVRLMNSFLQAPPALLGAQRKNDMEIMESVTLIDGGTPQDDGTITIRESPQQSERKYQQDVIDDEDQLSPLNYRLHNDEMERAYHEQQHPQHQQQHQYHPGQPQQPVLSASFHAMPFHNGYPGDVQGKLSLGQMKQPKSVHSPGMSLNQFQQQLYQQQMQGQPPIPPQQQQPMYPTPKPQVMPIFVIPPFTPSQQNHQQPPYPPQQTQQQASFPLPQNQQQSPYPPTNPPPPPPPPPQPSPTPTPQQIQTSPPTPPTPQPTHFNPQKFQEEFQHPFSTPPPSPIKSLAQLTANLLTTASNVMLSTSAAASALAKGELPIPTMPKSATLPSSPPKSILDSLPPLPGYPESSGYPSGLLSQGMLSAASIPSASQVLLPTNPSPYAPPTAARPGVIVDSDEPLFPNQLQSQEESLATKITQLVETGRKILYFPKGVMDTVDVVLKQMERSPMVAYWGDKFFAKVFGDTSGT